MSSEGSTGAPSAELHPAGCLLRVFWMGFGNILFLSLAAAIFRSSSYTWLDAAYAGTVSGMVLARYLDVRRFEGLTVDSQPATLGHFRRYAVGLALVGGIVWCVARASGPGFG